jgi:hypothetical protein
MSDTAELRAQAELEHLKAQTARELAEVLRAQAEHKRMSSWHAFALEAFKIIGAFVLGVGGVTAAISGYQSSEVKREKSELQVSKLQGEINSLSSKRDGENAELTRLTSEKAAVEESLRTAKMSLLSIEEESAEALGNLEKAQLMGASEQPALKQAIERVNKIGQEATDTRTQLTAPPKPPATSGPARPRSEYRVGLRTLDIPDGKRIELNERIQQSGYQILKERSASHFGERPFWFARQPAILYYADAALGGARELASVMKGLTGRTFTVIPGAGLGKVAGQEAVTFFVHYPAK